VSSPVFCSCLQTVDVPLSLGSRTVPVPQLPAASSSLTNPLTHQATHSTPLSNSQVGGHLTPTSCSSHCRLKAQDSALMAAGSRYIASTPTIQRTPLPTVVACLLRPLPSNDRCLQNHHLPTVVLWLLISQSLPSNGSTCHMPLTPWRTVLLGANILLRDKDIWRL
jgi:hypothetical protein